MDSHQLNSADEGLADLQPVDSDEEETNDISTLTEDQQKLEFMAALNLVPPAVMEGTYRVHHVTSTCTSLVFDSIIRDSTTSTTV